MSINIKLKNDILNYLTQPLPKCDCIVPQSIPVVFFGNIEKARVATLSINPSLSEFLDGNKLLLNQYSKRFCDREELGVADSDILTPGQSQQIYDSLMNYFHKNPYAGWFNRLESFVTDIFRTSFYDDTMVHLDIYPWATNPVWGQLRPGTRNILLKQYDLFAQIILASERMFDYVYINGRTVQNTVQKVFGIKFTTIKNINQVNTSGTDSCWEVFYAVLPNNCILVGTSANVPGSPITYETIADIKSTCAGIMK